MLVVNRLCRFCRLPRAYTCAVACHFALRSSSSFSLSCLGCQYLALRIATTRVATGATRSPSRRASARLPRPISPRRASPLPRVPSRGAAASASARWAHARRAAQTTRRTARRTATTRKMTSRRRSLFYVILGLSFLPPSLCICMPILSRSVSHVLLQRCSPLCVLVARFF